MQDDPPDPDDDDLSEMLDDAPNTPPNIYREK
jgi:hypothetical protein